MIRATSVALLLFCLPALAAEPDPLAIDSPPPPQSGPSAPPQSSPSAADSEFARLDLDKDGALSQQELGPQSTPGHDYIAVDRNRDGRIERAEFAAFESNVTPAPAEAPIP